MIFLLGGPPRVGKSIIANEIRQAYAVSVVSTDALGAVLENVLSPEAEPDLFIFERFHALPLAERVKLLREHPETLIEVVKKESRVVWRAVEAYIRREHEEGRTVLIEGVAVLPEFMSRLQDLPHRVVFIGNQGENHPENLRQSAAENAHDWLREVSDPYLDAFAWFVRRMSFYIEQEAQKYGFEYLAIDQVLFEQITPEVVKSLGLRAL